MEKASLEEILTYREKRASRREKLLLEYQLPMACLTLNIPGEYKDFPWARRCFREEIESFKLALEAEEISVFCEETEMEKAGYTAYFSVDTEPGRLKALGLKIEETHPLGRLFDIDIYEQDGNKISRQGLKTSERKCLVCGKNAFVCARSRAHSPQELRDTLLEIMENWLGQKLGDTVTQTAIWAIMSEAAVTPKPGLVDFANCGAHRDMDFFTFIDSASAILYWFRDCALAGFNSAAENSSISPSALFESLRPPGKIAEVLMKKAAKGVNTHRGYIFSLGILCAAYGRLYRDMEKPDMAGVLEFSKAMTAFLMRDFSGSCGMKQSNGEKVYAKSGIRGIRGEVSLGFPSVTEHALPLLCDMLKKGHSLNDAGTAALLKLLAHAEDTNMIHRGGEEAFRSIQEELKTFFSTDPCINAIREKAAALDGRFISLNLSPGGCADLLGVTFFLYRLFNCP